jgi:glucose-1-phosphate thymidylyltransferase
MKVIILCAGYATRLYPLTENQPKPLLTVGGKQIIQYIIDDLDEINEVDVIYIVTNNKFASHFEAATEHFKSKKEIKIVNDKTMSNDDRLGAIGDIFFTIEQNSINDDLLIIAGDNIFDLRLADFIAFARQHSPNGTIAAFDVKDRELAKKYGLVKINDVAQITDFQEKPTNPETTLASLGLYYYPRVMVSLFEKYITEGNNPDQPGNFVAWLIKHYAAFAYTFDGLWFDIGDFQSLEKADKYFIKKK